MVSAARARRNHDLRCFWRKGQSDARLHAVVGQATRQGPPNDRSLKLVPKTRQPDYDWLDLHVDPATLTIQGLTMDAQGGESAFFFEI